MTYKDKLEKLKKLADAMYYAAQQLTTDASRLHKAMDEYHKFIIHECKEEPKECMYSKDNYTDEDRKALCDGCETECRFNKKEEPVNNGLDLGCGVIWKDKEPVSEDLEKEFDDIYYQLEKEYSQDTGLGGFYRGYKFSLKIARHFANWQKKKDESYTKSMYKVGINAGKVLMKEQLMAKAVDGNITFDYYGDDDKTYGCIAHNSFCLEDLGLKDTDKVKMVLIKE